jgi:threonine dehydrogenase-like Zn-dependent dehydrogenase
MKSKVMVFREFKKDLTLEEVEIPQLKEGQVLVKLEAAGVCGSDIHMWKGEDPRTRLPMILGHEGVGRIVQIQGQKKTVRGQELKVGQRILWNRGVTCDQCYYCKVLKIPSLCENRKVYGINMTFNEEPHLNGCYSEYLILNPRTDIFKVEEDIDPSVLVSASCSGATVAHGFEGIKSLIGKTVVVQGPGPLGIYAIAFAKSLGAKNIIVIGGSKGRLELCKEFGANITLNRHDLNIEERKEAVLKATEGAGADLVIEAVGVGGSVEEGIKLLRKGGTYLSTGFAQPAGKDEIDFYADVVSKDITIKGVWVSDTSHTEMAMELVLKNPELFSKMITHRYKLEEANEAIRAMNSKEALKAVLIP